MAGRRESERLRKQRQRQSAYRKKMKAERRPSRDDIARVLLHAAIKKAWRWKHEKRERMLSWVVNTILEGLIAQGFDPKASAEAIEDLIDKYTRNRWEFRRKVHLLWPVADDGSETSTASASGAQD